MSIIEQIDLKFTSGNDVEVTRVVLTAEEWQEIRAKLILPVGFHPHLGGEAPAIQGRELDEIVFRDGSVHPNFDGDWLWDHCGEEDDIIGYSLT